MTRLTSYSIFMWSFVLFVSSLEAGDNRFQEIGSFAASDAHQAVAVDASAFFAITNRAVSKHDRQTGRLIERWQDSADKPLRHMNSGVVVDGRLYCAHSTWPNSQLVNTVEVWDTAPLKHRETLLFPETDGAINWIDRRRDAWWIVFAFYGESDVRKTRLVRYDDDWKETARFSFPEVVIKRFLPNSNSGGCFGPDDLLYVTGHDHGETYVLKVPVKAAGVAGAQVAELDYVGTIAAPITGQGIAWDRSTDEHVLFGIRRNKKEVVMLRLVPRAK